jgi:hypothetical protein
MYEKAILTGSQWLMSIILATWEAEVGRIMVQGQPRQKVHHPNYEGKCEIGGS